MGTEVHMDSNMDGLMGNNYQELLILTEFRPRKDSASLKAFSQAVSVPGAHQPAGYFRNSFLPPGHC